MHQIQLSKLRAVVGVGGGDFIILTVHELCIVALMKEKTEKRDPNQKGISITVSIEVTIPYIQRNSIILYVTAVTLVAGIELSLV